MIENQRGIYGEISQIEFRPYETDRGSVKNRVIEKMETEGYVYKDEVALMHYNSVLVFEKQ